MKPRENKIVYSIDGSIIDGNVYLFVWVVQGRKNEFRMGRGGGGGGAKQILQNFLVITLTFQKDTHCTRFLKYPLGYEPILALLLYRDLYVVIFKLYFLGLQNIGGVGNCPPPLPPPVPTAMLYVIVNL